MICDDFGRPTLNFRISVTQKCNLKCPYCHREGETSPATEMAVNEVERIAQLALGLGISNIKLTGGEPLMRPEIIQIVEKISKLRGLRDLSMTTNGTLLRPLAKRLRKSGLMRVNVSIPTLDAETFHRLTGGDLRHVTDGIEAAAAAGLYPVKLNMVLLQGVNEHEIERMIKFAEHSSTILQLIELEPMNIDESYYRRHHIAPNGIEEKLSRRAVEIRARKYMQDRRVYFLPHVKVEVIRPIENTEFCAHCTRLRVTSDGKLKPCLMRNDNLVDILTPLRNGADDEELTQILISAIKRREPYCKMITAQAV
jgi:cyclic pyranopterin phosphate synthase